jgi:hypothetical protein
MIPVPANPEFDVNAIAAFDQINPALVWGDGSIGLAVWQDWSGTQGDQAGTSVKGQMVRIDGTRFGEEFLINTQTAKSQGWPSVAKLDGGGFVVVWQDLSRAIGDTAGASVRAQILAADGTKVGGEFLVNSSVYGDQFLPHVTGLHGGGFAVCWADAGATGADSSGLSVKAQVFDATGDKVGSEALVNTQTRGGQGLPVLTGLANGGFAVVWQDSSGTLGDSSGTSIKLQLFDHDGAAKGSEVLVNAKTAGDQTVPAVAALSGGGLVVAWEDRSGGLSDINGSCIAAQIFRADGTRVGTEFLVNAETGADQLAPSVTGLGGGGFIVSWTDKSATLADIEGTAIKARTFNKLGVATGSDILINTSTAGNQSNAAIASVGGAGAIAIWEDRGPRSGAALNFGSEIKAQILLDPASVPFILSDLDKHMVVHSLENTRLVTTVQGYDANPLHSLSYGISGGEDAALFRIDRTTGKLTFKAAPDFELPADANGDNIYSVRVTVRNGLKSTTEEIKVIVDDVAHERLVGTIGDDYLLGSVGNDFLKGRSGTDDLYGEDGDDVLDGGAGVDHMEGGKGNDTFIVDNVLDHTHEHADEGIDTVRSSVSFTLDDDVENLVLTGKAAIGGVGNELANRMIGNSSANFLRGGDGDDRLLGNGGDDTLIGGSGKDVLYGGAGRDIFRFDYCPAGNREADKILDFSMSDHDVLQITRSGFSGFDHTGALLPDEFYAVPGNMLAHDSTDRLIYDSTSGKLFYDNDGTGQADAVLLGIISSNSNGTMGATLHPDLTYADFLIIS